MKLLPETASHSLPTWVEVSGYARIACPDCGGNGEQAGSGLAGHIFGPYIPSSECPACDGRGTLSVRDIFSMDLTPADFGLREQDGIFYMEVR